MFFSSCKMKAMYLLLFIPIFCFAQQPDYKYNIGLAGGWQTTFAERGPKGTTEVGDVEFLHPWSAVGYGYLDVRLNEHILVGIELGADQFDYGYVGTLFYSFSGSSSGSLISDGYIHLFKAGLRFSYQKALTKRFDLTATLNPAVGYYPFSDYRTDTAESNAYMHDVRPPGSNKIQYIQYPPYQKEGLHFTVKATVMMAYQMGKRLALTLDVAYQQGFSNFLTDSMSIRQYEPGTLKKFEQVYYTKVNGTCLPIHVGLRYRFGREERL